MKRDINKIVKAYEEKYIAQNKEHFHASDLVQLLNMSQTNGRTDVWKLLANAMNAGFMIGYQAAKRDMKKKKNK